MALGNYAGQFLGMGDNTPTNFFSGAQKAVPAEEQLLGAKLLVMKIQHKVPKLISNAKAINSCSSFSSTIFIGKNKMWPTSSSPSLSAVVFSFRSDV
jgi:hypothetical protein